MPAVRRLRYSVLLSLSPRAELLSLISARLIFVPSVLSPISGAPSGFCRSADDAIGSLRLRSLSPLENHPCCGSLDCLHRFRLIFKGPRVSHKTHILSGGLSLSGCCMKQHCNNSQFLNQSDRN